jgi:hypothetical protein
MNVQDKSLRAAAQGFRNLSSRAASAFDAGPLPVAPVVDAGDEVSLHGAGIRPPRAIIDLRHYDPRHPLNLFSAPECMAWIAAVVALRAVPACSAQSWSEAPASAEPASLLDEARRMADRVPMAGTPVHELPRRLSVSAAAQRHLCAAG